MTKIATPISHLFEDESAANEIINASDCLEGRDRYIYSKWPNQKLIHFDSSIIWNWSLKEKKYLKSSIMMKKDLELITFHLDSCYHKPEILDNIYFPRGRKYLVSEMLENARENVNWLKSFLERKILIGVENTNYFPTNAYEHVTDEDFISKIVEDNGLRLLLDISHAKITSYNRKIPYQKYMSNLPMDEVIQLHVSKNEINDNGQAIDAHNVPDEETYKEVAELIEKYPIEYITIEYYRDRYKLVSELIRCREFCKELF